MRHNKCDACIAKETLGYRAGKSYVSAARKNQRGTKLKTKDPQVEGERNPLKSRTKLMKKRTRTPKDKKQN